MGQVEEQKMESKRKKSGRTKQEPQDNKDKGQVQSEEVDLQQFDEQLHLQGLNEQQKHTEDPALADIAEGYAHDEKQTAEDTAQTDENKAPVMMEVPKVEIDKVNKDLRDMINASKNVLDKFKDNDNAETANIFKNVSDIFEGLKKSKILKLETVSLGLEWTDKINAVCGDAYFNNSIVDNLFSNVKESHPEITEEKMAIKIWHIRINELSKSLFLLKNSLEKEEENRSGPYKRQQMLILENLSSSRISAKKLKLNNQFLQLPKWRN